MRTIKFRWWDKVEDEMIDWDQISPLGQEDFTEETELRAMQFTGLKDSDGDDIYEGDILSYGKYTGSVELRGEDCTHIVEFNEETASFESYAIKEKVKHLCSIDNLESIVIGNIYENPELLAVPTAVL